MQGFGYDGDEVVTRKGTSATRLARKAGSGRSICDDWGEYDQPGNNKAYQNQVQLNQITPKT